MKLPSAFMLRFASRHGLSRRTYPMQVLHEQCDVAGQRCDLISLRNIRPTAERCRARGAVMEDLRKTSFQVHAPSLQQSFPAFRSRLATRLLDNRSHLRRQFVHPPIANGITDHGSQPLRAVTQRFR